MMQIWYHRYNLYNLSCFISIKINHTALLSFSEQKGLQLQLLWVNTLLSEQLSVIYSQVFENSSRRPFIHKYLKIHPEGVILCKVLSKSSDDYCEFSSFKEAECLTNYQQELRVTHYLKIFQTGVKSTSKTLVGHLTIPCI